MEIGNELEDVLREREKQLERQAEELVRLRNQILYLESENEKLRVNKIEGTENIQTIQMDYKAKLAGLEKRISQLTKEKDALKKEALDCVLKDEIIKEKDEYIKEVN